MASAVPHEPAPTTAIGCWRALGTQTGSSLVDQSGLRRFRRLSEQGVEIDQRQEKIRETPFDDEIGNDLPRIREQNAGTEAADEALQIFHRRTGDREHARLLHLHQIERGLAL